MNTQQNNIKSPFKQNSYSSIIGKSNINLINAKSSKLIPQFSFKPINIQITSPKEKTNKDFLNKDSFNDSDTFNP